VCHDVTEVGESSQVRRLPSVAWSSPRGASRSLPNINNPARVHFPPHSPSPSSHLILCCVVRFVFWIDLCLLRCHSARAGSRHSASRARLRPPPTPASTHRRSFRWFPARLPLITPQVRVDCHAPNILLRGLRDVSESRKWVAMSRSVGSCKFLGLNLRVP